MMALKPLIMRQKSRVNLNFLNNRGVITESERATFMRKTDDVVILRMKAEGATGKAIAEYFHVSEAAISKRLKRLRPIQEPVSFANLTDKQKRFVLLKAEGKTNTNAALEAFDATNRNSAKTIGSVLMRNADVSKAIQEIMHEEGLTRRHVVRRLRDLVDHPDSLICTRPRRVTQI